MFLFATIAQAGNLSLDLRTSGEKFQIELEGMVPCESQTLVLRDDEQDLRLKVRAAAPEDGMIYADVELSWAHGEKRTRLVEVHPTVLMREGKQVSVELDGPVDKVVLELDGADFPTTADAWCLPEPLRSR